MRRVAKVVIACFLGATVVSPIPVLADEEVDCSLVPNKDAFTPIDFLDEAMSVTVMKAD
jgi:hypothetical protein